MTLDRAMAENPELAKMYKADAQVREVIDLGKKIEGCARHVGVHAAGVVISPTPLTDYTALQLDPKGGKLISQYDMYSVEEAGQILLGDPNPPAFPGDIHLDSPPEAVETDEEPYPVAVSPMQHL